MNLFADRHRFLTLESSRHAAHFKAMLQLGDAYRRERFMPKEFINPNLHVALIHYPIAMLITGTLIEIFSFLWRRSGFRAAGRWMILIGALSMVPTLTSGIYAFRDVLATDEGSTWTATKETAPFSADQWLF